MSGSAFGGESLPAGRQAVGRKYKTAEMLFF
jgi:hypothetical protein